jgi:tRNA (guanine-N7-)-methyltransferase
MSLAQTMPLRLIRSYVRREGRLTPGQQRAIQQLWPRFGVEPRELIDLNKLFGREANLTLEIGFGNGETILHLAEQNPDKDFLGIEVHRPGVGHLLLELEKRGITNVRVVREDAVEAIRSQIPDRSLGQILILFPDPWPKKRHYKRRLVQSGFIDLLGNKLKQRGSISMATDWESYAEHMLAVMERSVGFRNLAGTGNFALRPKDLPVSKFERRGKCLGHHVWNLCYQRI